MVVYREFKFPDGLDAAIKAEKFDEKTVPQLKEIYTDLFGRAPLKGARRAELLGGIVLEKQLLFLVLKNDETKAAEDALKDDPESAEAKAAHEEAEAAGEKARNAYFAFDNQVKKMRKFYRNQDELKKLDDANRDKRDAEANLTKWGVPFPRDAREIAAAKAKDEAAEAKDEAAKAKDEAAKAKDEAAEAKADADAARAALAAKESVAPEETALVERASDDDADGEESCFVQIARKIDQKDAEAASAKRKWKEAKAEAKSLKRVLRQKLGGAEEPLP